MNFQIPRPPVRTLTLLLAMTLGLSLPGCKSRGVPTPKSDYYTAATYPNITAEGSLAKRMLFQRPTIEDGSGGVPMQVTVPIRIERNKQTPVQYRFIFLDEVDRPAGPQMEWTYKLIPGKSREFLSASALATEAIDWNLQIREAQ